MATCICIFSEKPEVAPEAPADTSQRAVPKVQSVDDFCPDEGLDASFLDDVKESKAVTSQGQNEQPSDDR